MIKGKNNNWEDVYYVSFNDVFVDSIIEGDAFFAIETAEHVLSQLSHYESFYPKVVMNN
jgi:hypothetical protein